MDVFSRAERLMGMDEATWARHASPWSVWTRFLVLPLLSLAIWSRVWLGEYAVVPVSLSLLWTWYNPRAFPPPKSTNNWGSKATFGERIFLDRQKVSIPAHHLRAANVLSAMSAVGAVVWLFGLYRLNFWATVAGMIATVLPKAWFCDRMVWIYDELKDTHPTYASWLK